MTVYIESSALVRIVAQQRPSLPDWESIAAPLASVLVEVEVPRAIARLRDAGALSEQAAVAAVLRDRDGASAGLHLAHIAGQALLGLGERYALRRGVSSATRLHIGRHRLIMSILDQISSPCRQARNFS